MQASKEWAFGMRLLAVGLLTAACTSGGSSLQLQHEALGAFARGDFKKTVERAERIDAAGSRELAELDLARLRAAQGRAYWELGRDDEAIPALEQAVRLREQSSEEETLELGSDLRMLATVLENEGRRPEALIHLERFVTIREAHYGPGDPESARALFDIAWLYRSLRDREGAEHAFRRSIAAYEAASPPDLEGLVEALVEYGRYLRNTGREDEVLAIMQRLQEISPGAWRQLR